MDLQSPASAPPRTPRVFTVEFWRFAFTALVCLFHLEIYFRQQGFLVSGSGAVEFFFVLAGFTMAMSAKRGLAGRTAPVTTREAHAKAVEFVTNKLRAIYPILIVALLLWLVTTPAAPGTSKLEMLQNTEWELLLMVGTPFGNEAGVAPIIPLWFLTALIVVGYLYTFAIYRNYDFVRFAAPAVGILFYSFFAMNAEKVLDFYLPMGFLNAGMVRAVAEMSLGMSMFYLYEVLSQKKPGIVRRVLLSLLELYAVYRFFVLTLWQPLGIDNYRRIVYIMIIVLLSFLNVTLLARMLNRRFMRLLGGISLAMYLCHLPLVNVYFYLLGAVKMKLWTLAVKSPVARALSDFLQGTGGYDKGFRPIPMTWKDMLIYITLVIVASALITLAISAVKRLVVKLYRARCKKQQAEKALAAGSGGDAGNAEVKEEANAAP